MNHDKRTNFTLRDKFSLSDHVSTHREYTPLHDHGTQHNSNAQQYKAHPLHTRTTLTDTIAQYTRLRYSSILHIFHLTQTNDSKTAFLGFEDSLIIGRRRIAQDPAKSPSILKSSGITTKCTLISQTRIAECYEYESARGTLHMLNEMQREAYGMPPQSSP